MVPDEEFPLGLGGGECLGQPVELYLCEWAVAAQQVGIQEDKKHPCLAVEAAEFGIIAFGHHPPLAFGAVPDECLGVALTIFFAHYAKTGYLQALMVEQRFEGQFPLQVVDLLHPVCMEIIAGRDQELRPDFSGDCR